MLYRPSPCTLHGTLATWVGVIRGERRDRVEENEIAGIGEGALKRSP